MARLAGLPASFVLLAAAIILYALFGSPTPDDPGWVEAAIGLLLLLAVGSSGLARAANSALEQGFFLRCVQLFFLIGLVLPTLSGIANGNALSLVLRDLLAFCFLALPVFLAARVAAMPDGQRLLTGLLALAGLAFAIRTLVPVFNIWVPTGELIYLSNSPLAMFAACLAAALLWRSLDERRAGWPLTAAAAGCALGLLVAAMVLDLQRATIGAVALTLAGLALRSLIIAPRRAAPAFAMLLALLGACYPWMADIVAALARKTAQVGLNARVAEAEAVVRAVGGGPLSIMFGRGWGATLASPAVAGIEVNYTHSLLTTMLLKGGLPLLFLSALMLAAAIRELARLSKQDAGMALALAGPLLIPALLYASHKSLDYGLVLLLIAVWSIPRPALPIPQSSDKT